MKIATWNVNSIKVRLPNLLAWLKEAEPDVVCLQELKCVDDAFPRSAIEDAGYNVETHGQKTYNGVALLSRSPMEDVSRGLPGMDQNPGQRGSAIGGDGLTGQLFLDARQIAANGLARGQVGAGGIRQ